MIYALNGTAEYFSNLHSIFFLLPGKIHIFLFRSIVVVFILFVLNEHVACVFYLYVCVCDFRIYLTNNSVNISSVAAFYEHINVMYTRLYTRVSMDGWIDTL